MILQRQSSQNAIKSECEAELDQLVRALRAVRKEIADQHEMVRKGPNRYRYRYGTYMDFVCMESDLVRALDGHLVDGPLYTVPIC